MTFDCNLSQRTYNIYTSIKITDGGTMIIIFMSSKDSGSVADVITAGATSTSKDAGSNAGGSSGGGGKDK